jgi:hypothetical protein
METSYPLVKHIDIFLYFLCIYIYIQVMPCLPNLGGVNSKHNWYETHNHTWTLGQQIQLDWGIMK